MVKVDIYTDTGVIPVQATQGSAGVDFVCVTDQPIVIQPGEQVIIDTRIKVAIPQGYEMQIRGRSGLAMKHQVVITHGVGTIDSDYRGNIGVFLMNHGKEPYTINFGDRIAQGVLCKHEVIEWNLVNNEQDLSSTIRGEGGFGSTGK